MERQNGGSFDSSNSDDLNVIQQRGPYTNVSSQEMSLVPCETTTELKSEPSEPFVVVGGYKVKKELAPLVTAIFRKHGNIVRGCSFSMESRWCLLELVCSIYKKLEASSMLEMKPLELKSIYLQIRDLQRVKVKVGWLHERLNWISENLETYRAAKARSVAVLCVKTKEVETCENELEELMATVEKLQERLGKAKDEQSAAMSVVDKINSFSLVHDLV